MIDWRTVSLLGIDVGFSAQNKTTGIAQYRFGNETRLLCVGSQPHDRATAFTDGVPFDAIAIDGPIVPLLVDGMQIVRDCERTLSRGSFAARCKPGYSHFGTGLQLRRAATTIAAEMLLRRRHASVPIVEAFPNAFLGVMLDDDIYREMGRIPRGKKSDVFFARAVKDCVFDRLFDHLQWHDNALKAQIISLATMTTRASHEHRAALTCVLTAGCALARASVPIGDAAGGYIHLPPRETWANWARDALL